MKTTITNATATYTIVMLVFACGMWAILVYGSTLQAPMDLAGQWELSAFGGGGDIDDRPLNATVDQSGRFVRLRIGNEKPADLRISNDRRSTTLASRPRVVLEGDSMSATFEPSPAPSVHHLTITRPDGTTQRYTARMVERTYPRPAANKPQDLTPPTDTGSPRPMTPSTPASLPTQPSSAPNSHAR